MKIQTEIQALSPARAGAKSFFLFTVNNDSGFQRFVVPDRFDTQMHSGNAKGLLLFTHPASIVANALFEGAYDDDALRQWIDEAELHLDVVRRHRRRMIVIEKDATNEAFAMTAFNGAFPGCQPPDEFSPDPQRTPAVFSLIALHAVRQFRPAAHFLSELEASSAAPNADEPDFDRSLALIASELRGIKTGVTFDELEITNKRLELSNRDLQLRIDDLEQQNRYGVTGTKDILTQQVLDLQSVLQETDAKRISDERKSERINAALTIENAALKKSIDLIRNSTSWRLTTPVRAIKSVFSR